MRAGGEYTTLEGRGVEGHRPKSPGLVFRGQQSRGSGGSAQRDGAETRWGRGWEDERTVDRRRRGYGVMAVACFLEHSSGYDSHLVGWKRELRGHLGQVGTNVREGASVGSQRVFGKAEVAAGRAWMGREKYGPTTLQHPVYPPIRRAFIRRGGAEVGGARSSPKRFMAD